MAKPSSLAALRSAWSDAMKRISRADIRSQTQSQPAVEALGTRDVTSDPDENIFLEFADAAKADYLVTGNQKHFPRFWKRTAVITSREFIDLAAPHLLG
jgi:predicted nucleic acid-binding protein